MVIFQENATWKTSHKVLTSSDFALTKGQPSSRTLLLSIPGYRRAFEGLRSPIPLFHHVQMDAERAFVGIRTGGIAGVTVDPEPLHQRNIAVTTAVRFCSLQKPRCQVAFSSRKCHLHDLQRATCKSKPLKHRPYRQVGVEKAGRIALKTRRIARKNEPAAGPSTTLPAIRLREAPLKRTRFIFINRLRASCFSIRPNVSWRPWRRASSAQASTAWLARAALRPWRWQRGPASCWRAQAEPWRPVWLELWQPL